MRNWGWLRCWWIVVMGLLIGCSKKDEAEEGAAGSKKKAPSYFDDEDTIPEPTPKPPTDVDLVRLAAIQFRPKDYESSKDRLVVWTRLSNGKDERILGESPGGYQGPVWLTKSLDTMIYVRRCKSEECAHPNMDENVFLFDFRTNEEKPLLPKTVKHYYTKGFIFGQPTKEEGRVSFKRWHGHLDISLAIFFIQGFEYSNVIDLKTGKVLSWPIHSHTWVYLGKGRFLLGNNLPNGVAARMGAFDFLKGKILEPESVASPIQLSRASPSQDGRVFLQIRGRDSSDLQIDTIFLRDRERNILWRKIVEMKSGDPEYEVDPNGKWMYFQRSRGWYRISFAELEALDSPMTIQTLINHSEVVIEPGLLKGRQEFRSPFALIPL